MSGGSDRVVVGRVAFAHADDVIAGVRDAAQLGSAARLERRRDVGRRRLGLERCREPPSRLADHRGDGRDHADGSTVAVAGERNAVRLGNVRRLDMRASRDFTVGRGSLRFFTEVMNITDRINPCCLVYEPVTLPNGQPSLVGDEQGQAGLTGNLGLLWQF